MVARYTQTHNPGRETDAQSTDTTHDVNAKRTDARAKRNAARHATARGPSQTQFHFQSREHTTQGHARAPDLTLTRGKC